MNLLQMSAYASMDPPGDDAFVTELYVDNFLAHYHGSRAPFGVYLHAQYFTAQPVRSVSVCLLMRAVSCRSCSQVLPLRGDVARRVLRDYATGAACAIGSEKHSPCSSFNGCGPRLTPTAPRIFRSCRSVAGGAGSQAL